MVQGKAPDNAGYSTLGSRCAGCFGSDSYNRKCVVCECAYTFVFAVAVTAYTAAPAATTATFCIWRYHAKFCAAAPLLLVARAAPKFPAQRAELPISLAHNTVERQPKPLAAVCNLSEEATSTPLPTPLRTLRSPNAHVSNVVATSTVQYMGASVASAALRASYCNAVLLHSHNKNNRRSYVLLLRLAVIETQLKLRYRALRPVTCTIAYSQEFEGACRGCVRR